jgi:hypothetical protein
MPDYEMHVLLREAADLAVAVEKRKLRERDDVKLLHLMPAVATLVRKIEQWRPGMASVVPEYHPDEEHFNNIWRQGLYCYVYHEIYALPSDSPQIQACVEEALVSFERISWLQACLYPMFLISIHARCRTSRKIIESALLKMHTTLGFTAPLSVVLVLQSLWEAFDNDPLGVLKWREVMVQRGMEINVLL